MAQRAAPVRATRVDGWSRSLLAGATTEFGQKLSIECIFPCTPGRVIRSVVMTCGAGQHLSFGLDSFSVAQSQRERRRMMVMKGWL